MIRTCDAGGVHSVDFRALNAGISGILCGDEDVVVGDCWTAVAELWLLLRRRKGGISGICIGWDTGLIEAFLRWAYE